MNPVRGYFWAIANYLRTEKARHDVRDYVTAALLMLGTMLLLRILVAFLWQ
ncbi:MAG: hypothetical protein ABFC84_17325 [Veillonellales bacterium]